MVSPSLPLCKPYIATVECVCTLYVRVCEVISKALGMRNQKRRKLWERKTNLNPAKRAAMESPWRTVFLSGLTLLCCCCRCCFSFFLFGDWRLRTSRHREGGVEVRRCGRLTWSTGVWVKTPSCFSHIFFYFYLLSFYFTVRQVFVEVWRDCAYTAALTDLIMIVLGWML